MSVSKQFGRSEFRAPDAGGFVLVATIWVIAGMVLFMGFVAYSAAKVQQTVFSAKQDILLKMDARATEATVLYLGATQMMSHAGMTTTPFSSAEKADEFNPFSTDVFAVRGGELRLDSRPYHGLGETRFSLLDTGGRVSLRIGIGGNSERLTALLLEFGLAPAKIRQLSAAVLDYIDHDDLENLDGMERNGYESRALLHPTNRFLTSPTQLANVFGWQVALGENSREFLEEVTASTGNKYNFNSMSRAGMKALNYLDDSAIDRIMAYRQDNVFVTLADVNREAGVLIEQDALAFSSIPDPYLRLKLWHPSSLTEQWVGIRFTPLSGFSPWEIDYRIDQERLQNVQMIQRQVPQSNVNPSNVNNVFIAATIPDSVLFR